MFSEYSKLILRDRYLLKNETPKDMIHRVCQAYAGSNEHKERLIDYIDRKWFLPATPILANGGTHRGLPISCFVNEFGDSIESIADTFRENIMMAAGGGGIGSYWGNLRTIGTSLSENRTTSGIIPFVKIQDAMTLAISQGSIRRGSSAAYLHINNPEILEFIELRKPTGGDPNRKALNMHHGIIIDDIFMNNVLEDNDHILRDPVTNSITQTVPARQVWYLILTLRMETGEPYIIFIDNVNKNVPESYKKLNLHVKTSNLCSEIMLHTGKDYNDKERTAVCCLASVNLEYYGKWKQKRTFIHDVMWFLDNVLDSFIDNDKPGYENAKYSAMMERSVGLGTMGFHSLLQKKMLTFDDHETKQLNREIYQHLHQRSEEASLALGDMKGSCEDNKRLSLKGRFTHRIAIAPTATISILMNNTSPSVDPYITNIYVQKTLSGTNVHKNKFLKVALDFYGMDKDYIWDEILANGGSVQKLEFLTKREKDIFKTSFEIDQLKLIQLAAERQNFICQSQSLNLFLNSDSDKGYVNKLHIQAWKLGIKSLYYVRSKSIVRPESLNSCNLNQGCNTCE